ncbi:MAG: gliding motility-associated ABC transporter substrate-binding protein GldG [Saprospiraceae bacterium]|nr:gliding motility-associated ABC transporter substrate-binding protein GldG [Saprospiraceae bacterium]
MFKRFKSNRTQSVLTIALVAVILVVVNIISNSFNSHIDLTEEGRFTLTEPTKNLLQSVKDPVLVRVLLDGKFPAGFKRLQASTREILEDFHKLNSVVEYKFEDPSVIGNNEEKKKRYEEMAKDGLVPMRLRVVDDKEKTEQYIFPYAIVNYHGNEVIVKLLENDVPGMNPEMALNNSIALLEYKLSNAVQKLLNNRKPNILFVEGHNELKREETADLEQTLSAFYKLGRLNLDSITLIPFDDINNRVDVLVIAKPKTAFSEKQKFQLDHYIMQGGKVIWLIDRLNADLAGMQQTGEMLPVDYPLNIEDQLFKYGARINPNMVLDLRCAKIPLKVGANGNAPQMDMFDWYYHPLASPNEAHPVTKSLDLVWLQFPASIDTIRTKTDIRKTILLASSKASRAQFTPTKLNFEILRYKAEPDKFNKGFQPLAVMLEGTFSSLFENRVTTEQTAVLQQLGQQFTPLSKPTKMLVVADGDIARNDYDFKQNAMLPLGYNRFVNYKFANKDFLQNAIEYMLDDKGIIAARGKEVKLRLMDKEMATDNANVIRLANILLPLLLIGAFGLFFMWRRKKQFAI